MTGRIVATVLFVAHVVGGAAAAQRRPVTGPDTAAIRAFASVLAADSMKGRGPWTPEGRATARRLADELTRLGARPLIGTSLLVPFVVAQRPTDTLFNVVGYLPPRAGSTDSTLVGLTAHFDHLGIDSADAAGDSIYNGFLDDAIGVAIVRDVARRFAAAPGERGLAIFFFDLEEQGLLGSIALVRDRTSHPALRRMTVVIGMDAGAPAGEALEWELMGGEPSHPAAQVADSLAVLRGWSVRRTPPRGISDVYLFSRVGIPILFPIPGARWRGYTPAQRDSAMARFDHYHRPDDRADPAFPLVGTWHMAEWLWQIVAAGTRGGPPGR